MKIKILCVFWKAEIINLTKHSVLFDFDISVLDTIKLKKFFIFNS